MDSIILITKSSYFEFSNYYSSDFVDVDGIRYLNNECFYQSRKFFSSNGRTMEYFNLIIQTDSPQKSKDMGAQRKNYRGDAWLINKSKPYLGKVSDAIDNYKDIRMVDNWEMIKEEVMYYGLKLKFSQNAKLKSLLLNTGSSVIVEDSARDYYWGNGKDKTGKNRLGVLLMYLREELKPKSIYIIGNGIMDGSKFFNMVSYVENLIIASGYKWNQIQLYSRGLPGVEYISIILALKYPEIALGLSMSYPFTDDINRLHHEFSTKIGYDTLNHIKLVLNKSNTTFQRIIPLNTSSLLAFTSSDILIDDEVKYIWDVSTSLNKHHFNIDTI